MITMRSLYSVSVLHYSLKQLIRDAEDCHIKVPHPYIVNVKLGIARSFFDIGKLYYSSEWYHSAMAWFLEAEKRGYAKARKKIGLMYQEALGVAADNKMALECYYRSVWQGHEKAIKKIYQLYDDGHYLNKSELDRIKEDQKKLNNVQEKEEKISCLEKENIGLRKQLKEALETLSRVSNEIEDLERVATQNNNAKAIERDSD